MSTVGNNSSLDNAVGKTYVDDRHELVSDDAPDARQSNPQLVIRHSQLPEGTRVIAPGTMVTMDFNENRWNLHVDDNNKVTKVRKG
ncbi:unnamed protein product [Sphagnum tenellum]